MAADSTNLQRLHLYQNNVEPGESFTPLGEMGDKINKFVNVYGVVVSYALPKRNSSDRASHRYSCSFSIIDPSLTRPSQSICVNWFMNEAELDIRTGDIVRCHKLKVNKYKDYPQLVGNPDKCPFVIYRQSRNFLTGLPQADVSTADESSAKSSSASAANGGNKVKTAFLNNGEWKSVAYFPNSPFGQRDVALLRMLAEWSENTFFHSSLADEFMPHCSLHSALTHLHARVRSPAYAALTPAANPLFSSVASLPSERCDVVCMVVESVAASVEGAPVGSLSLWDGSTHGLLSMTDALLHRAEMIHSSLSAANEYSRCSTVADLAAAKQRVAASAPQTHPAQFLGSALVARAHEPSLNAFLAKFRPGMWIRIRNLHLDGDSTAVHATIHADTHVCLLYPHFHDVSSIVRSYYLRLVNLFVASAHPSAQLAAASSAAAQTSSSAAAPYAAVTARTEGAVGAKRKATSAANGDPFIPLALTLVKPVPAKYCCWGRIVDWWPKQIDKFVVSSTITCPSSSAVGGKEVTKHRLVFGLRLVDDTAAVDAIVCDSEAEHFLGVTARDLHADRGGARAAVAARLLQHRAAEEVCEFYLKSYSTSLVSEDDGQKATTSRAEGVDAARRETRRLQLYNSKLM